MTNLQAQKIKAIALTVTDIDRSLIFYTKALHFELISDNIVAENFSDHSGELRNSKIRIATLKLGDENIRLMQYLDQQGKPIPQDAKSNDLWFQHLAIVVSNMDRAYTHLQSFAIEPISTAPQTIPPENQAAAYIQAFKFRDPDRHPLELICFPPDKGQEKWHQKSEQLFLGIELLDYIEPATGRPMPSDLQPYDTAYMQVELVAKLSDRSSAPSSLIKDPTGHCIRLSTESSHSESL